MISFFANRLINKNLKDSMFWETVNFYVLYLFSGQTYFYCWLNHYVSIWYSRNGLPDKVIITYDHVFEPDNRGDSKEKIISSNAEIIRKIKPVTIKPKKTLNLSIVIIT